YYISLISRSRGISPPDVAPEALRRLQGYDFPGNLTELEGLIARAMLQGDTVPGSLRGRAAVLTEEVFWSVSTRSKRFRVNLLNTYPRLRQFLRSSWWPDRINYGFTLPVFAIVVAILFLAPQSRDANIALNLFWAW
ncbi:AAA family ATPase, partial [Corallococcus praedator]